VRREHQELLAAPAPHHVVHPHRGGQQRGHLLQHRVARLVAVPVVDLLEVVDVHQQHRDREGVPARRAEDDVQRLIEVTAVVQAGEVVGPRHPVELLGAAPQLGAQDRDLHRSRHARQQLGRVRWLAQVVVRTGPQGAHDVLAAGAAGEEDDRQVLRARVVLEGSDRLEAVQHRHLDVEQDGVDAPPCRPARARLAVLGLEHRVARGLELHAHERAHRLAVVRDEDRRAGVVRHVGNLRRSGAA
jgi:hypothetical protein